MSHRHHLICLVAAVSLGAWLLIAGSGGLALAGVSLALLICPLVMGAVMWMLMRQPRPTPNTSETGRREEPVSAGPR
jgi:hypothetical protein